MVIFQIIVTVGLLVFLLNVILNLSSLKRPNKNSQVQDPQPLVSVLIPARNEQDKITSCLESLQKQDYGNYEILVLDDNSKDDTANIVIEIAKRDSRVQLIKGEPLPEGWSGKPFACQQLANKARGAWYIFTDADTTHRPNMIRHVIALALELKPSLLSGFPRQHAGSILEKIIIPVFYFLIMGWVPLWVLQRIIKSKSTFVNGQFFLFNSTEFWRIGGYEVAKNRIMEDLWMSIEMNNRGGKVVTVDLSNEVTCHMYTSLREMWDGFGKSIFGVVNSSLLIIPILGVLVYLFYLMPFLSLPDQLLISGSPASWWPLAAFQVFIVLLMRLLLKIHFKESILSAILHPIGLGFFVVNAIYIFFLQLVGGSIHWKERTYVADSGAK